MPCDPTTGPQSPSTGQHASPTPSTAYDSADPAFITQYLHQQMPLTRAMAVRVLEATSQRAIVLAPLAPNLNHQQTAFGGSIATLGIIAGWVYLHCRLQSLGLATRLIIQKSQVEYLSPITSDFEATCIAPPDDQWQAFHTRLTTHGRARLERPAQIQCQTKIAAIHHGTYVAIDEQLATKRGVRG